MSEDHNVITRLLRKGEITLEQAKAHEQRNTLTNAMGIWRIFQIDFHRIENSYRYILLSSDGLHGYVTQEDIQAVIDNPMLSLEDKVDALIARANIAGGFDNCTVILLENTGERDGNH